MSGPQRVLLVGGEMHGRTVMVPEFSLADPCAPGYRAADFFHLADHTKRLVWSGQPMPRIAVSFTNSEGFPTFAEICEMNNPKVPDDMHERLQDAWRVQLERMETGRAG